MEWLGVPVIVQDDAPEHHFNMPLPNEDPEQKPAFLVTQSTVDWVRQDFARHEPGLEYMIQGWYGTKALAMQTESTKSTNEDNPPSQA